MCELINDEMMDIELLNLFKKNEELYNSYIHSGPNDFYNFLDKFTKNQDFSNKKLASLLPLFSRDFSSWSSNNNFIFIIPPY